MQRSGNEIPPRITVIYAYPRISDWRFPTNRPRVSRLVVPKILNHVESGITAVYDRHSYDAEKRHALDLWGNYVERVAAGKPALSNVIEPARTGQ